MEIVKMITLTTQLSILKQELKSKAEKLRHHKKLAKSKRINKQFFHNPKKVYRSMKRDAISIENVPAKEGAESFWKGIWPKGTISTIKLTGSPN